MASLSPYLFFNGNCREAMTFYQKCLGGELNLMSVGESPMGDKAPAERKNRIMHAALKNGSFQIMAADTMGVQPAVNGSGLALSLMFDSNDELDAAFNRLSSGGKISQAPKEEFFGYYADLTDRYGFNWILVHSRPAA